MDAHRIQAVGWLIEDEDRRPTDQRAGQPKPLLHAERILLRQPFAKRRQPDELQRVGNAAFRQAENSADDLEVFLPGQVAVECGRFNKGADFLQNRHPVGGVRLAVDLKAARSRMRQAEEHLHGGGFSRAVWAEKPVNAPFPDMQIQIGNRREVPVRFGQVLCLNDIHTA